MDDDSNLNSKSTDEEMAYACRCHTCSIEFPTLEDLLTHVSQNHTTTEGRVECGECQDQFTSTEEYIDHCRSHHDEEIAKSVLNLAHADIEENSSGLPTQITILNDNGETVGHHVDDDINPSLALHNTSARKRRPSAKVREIIQNESQVKKLKTHHQKQNVIPTTTSSSLFKGGEVEIDVSEVTCVRLKTNNNNNSESEGRNEEIIQYLERVEEKLDCILKHFNVPHQLPSPTTTPTSMATIDARKFFKNTPKSSRMSSLSSTPIVVRSQVVPVRSPYTTITGPEQPQEITQYVISEELCEATFLKSRNRGNFAKNLVYAAFPFDERVGRNCYGRRGGPLCGPKEPLEAAKLDAVKDAVFQKFPCLPEDEEPVWKKECVIAIDTALRSEMRHRILAMNGSSTDMKIGKSEC